ncbi:MAG: hypothetical protein II797_05475 [Clostridia bacterium]|nr:hypothetical protein [Clostridia bacterium]
MNILLAFPERDLLSVYEKLLETLSHRVSAVFDGMQFLSLASAEKYDLIVYDEKLPRVELSSLLSAVHETGIPSILLKRSAPSPEELCQENLPSGFLVYPFSPDDFRSKLERVVSAASVRETFSVCQTDVPVEGFVLRGRCPLCEEEISLLKRICSGERPSLPAEARFCRSLNRKFRLAALPLEISLTGEIRHRPDTERRL